MLGHRCIVTVIKTTAALNLHRTPARELEAKPSSGSAQLYRSGYGGKAKLKA